MPSINPLDPSSWPIGSDFGPFRYGREAWVADQPMIAPIGWPEASRLQWRAGWLAASSGSSITDWETWARALEDHARAVARAHSDLSWKADSARSMARKARVGYRASSILGDQPWEPAHYDLKHAQAIASLALAFNRDLGRIT